MKGVLKTIATAIGLLAVFIVLAIFLLWRETASKTEARIRTALATHYSGAALQILDRRDWQYANQICFDVVVTANDKRWRRILMIQGDLDGGVWEFAREFPSMAACEEAYYHG